MTYDWRGMMDEIRIPWRDRGKNSSRKNVNICCPQCREDDGFHMALSEGKDAFYCFRSPEHSGMGERGLISLLVKLGVGRVEAVRLLNKYRGDRRVEAPVPVQPPPGKLDRIWGAFEAATNEAAVLDYIFQRGFIAPGQVVERYDIRVTRHGVFRWRMLMPMLLAGSLKSWTGRAISDSMTPKYLNMETGIEGLVYMPREARDLTIICEGPLDALKLAVAGEGLPIAALALTGKQLNEVRLWNVHEACSRSTRIKLCLDADTRLAERSRMLAELRGAFPAHQVSIARLPPDAKDAGGLPQAQATEWLRNLLVS